MDLRTKRTCYDCKKTTCFLSTISALFRHNILTLWSTMWNIPKVVITEHQLKTLWLPFHNICTKQTAIMKIHKKQKHQLCVHYIMHKPLSLKRKRFIHEVILKPSKVTDHKWLNKFDSYTTIIFGDQRNFDNMIRIEFQIQTNFITCR